MNIIARLKAIIEWDPKSLANILSEYIAFKKSIHISNIDSHIIYVANREVKEIYEKFSSDKLEIDQFIKSIDTDESIGGLNDDEIENQRDLLYAKFSHYEYVRNLYEINSLILTRKVPRNLEIYISEARYCYAFGQYNAVYSLCRTILEFCLKYLYCIKYKNDLESIAREKFPIGRLGDDLCEHDENLNEEIKGFIIMKLVS